jgi:hypothetical protein
MVQDSNNRPTLSFVMVKTALQNPGYYRGGGGGEGWGRGLTSANSRWISSRYSMLLCLGYVEWSGMLVFPALRLLLLPVTNDTCTYKL